MSRNNLTIENKISDDNAVSVNNSVSKNIHLTSVTMFSMLRGPVSVCETKGLRLLSVNETVRAFLGFFGNDDFRKNVLKSLSTDTLKNLAKRLTTNQEKLVNRNDANIGFGNPGGLSDDVFDDSVESVGYKYIAKYQKRVMEFCEQVLGKPEEAGTGINGKCAVMRSEITGKNAGTESGIIGNYERVGRALLYLIINDDFIDEDDDFYIGKTLSPVKKSVLRGIVESNSNSGIAINFYALIFSAMLYIDSIGNETQNRGYETLRCWRAFLDEGSNDVCEEESSEEKDCEKKTSKKSNSKESDSKENNSETKGQEKPSAKWYENIPNCYKSAAVSFLLDEISEEDIKNDEKFRTYSEIVSTEKAQIPVGNSIAAFDDIFVCNWTDCGDSKRTIFYGEIDISIMMNFLTAAGNFTIMEGDEGVGKSMMARALLYEGARRHVKSFMGEESSANKVFVLLPLDKYANVAYDLSLFDFMHKHINSVDSNITKNDIMALLEEGNMTILFDNLDSIHPAVRKTVMRKMITFAAEYPCTYFCFVRNGMELKSMIDDLQEETKFKLSSKRFGVKDFTDEQVERLSHNIEKLRCEKSESGESENDSSRYDVFISEIEAAGYSELISNPQRLSIIYSLFLDNNKVIETGSQLYRTLFDDMYRKASSSAYNSGRQLCTGFSKLELKRFFAEFSARCFYDGVFSLSGTELTDYFEKIIQGKYYDEDVNNLIHDFSEGLGILVFDKEHYSFRYSSFRDYFAALYFLSEEGRSGHNIAQLLDKENDGRELVRYMYELDPKYCDELVEKTLEKNSESWMLAGEGDWKSFKAYLKSTYNEYGCNSSETMRYWGEYENTVRTPLMEMVHYALRRNEYTPEFNAALGFDFRTPREMFPVYGTTSGSHSPRNSDCYYNDALCEALKNYYLKYDYDIEADCISLFGELPERYEYTTPTWPAVYDDDGELLEEEMGPMITVSGWTTAEKYEFVISINDTAGDDIDKLDDDAYIRIVREDNDGTVKKQYSELTDIMMSISLFKPYRDYLRLKVLYRLLSAETDLGL